MKGAIVTVIVAAVVGMGGGYVTSTNELATVSERVEGVKDVVRLQEVREVVREQRMRDIRDKVIALDTNQERVMKVLEQVADALTDNSKTSSALAVTLGRIEERLHFLELNKGAR